MQSYFSNKTQPYPLASYPTFVAEVASTFNEALLIDHMLKNDQGRRRAAVAARQLPREHQGHGVPPDAVRRVRAADARDGGEGAADHRRRAGQAVSRHHAASTTATIRASAIVDDYIAHEWSYIPHFYRDFYVFQYATSFTASEALAAEGEGRRSPTATKRYLTFLSAGGSKYPIDLLKDAGVDMTTDEPLDLTMQEDEPRDGRDGGDPRQAPGNRALTSPRTTDDHATRRIPSLRRMSPRCYRKDSRPRDLTAIATTWRRGADRDERRRGPEVPAAVDERRRREHAARQAGSRATARTSGSPSARTSRHRRW